MDNLWHWLGAHAFAMMAVAYLGSALCLILLALWVLVLTRRLAAIVRESEKQAALVAQLARSVDEQKLGVLPLTRRLGAIERQAARVDRLAQSVDEQKLALAALQVPAPVGKDCHAAAAPGESSTFKAVRDDIESLIADMVADHTERGDPTP